MTLAALSIHAQRYLEGRLPAWVEPHWFANAEELKALLPEAEIEAILARRKEARAAKDFATSDAIRDELTAKGVEVMDGDPLGWEWKLGD